jgi:predicted kinase
MQLSQHYRNDSDDGLDSNTRQYLDEHYLKHLKNLNHANPKLLVVFSGGNAMGKTTIARKIEERFHGLVLENDEVKRHLLNYTPGIGKDELNRTTWQYTINLYQRLDSVTPNGLVVRDGIIDWYYHRILPVFEEAGYPLFIIAFDVTREKATELIKRRGDTPTVKEERFYKLLDDHEIHTKRFRMLYKPDVVLSDSTIFNHNLVLDALEKKFYSLRQSG